MSGALWGSIVSLLLLWSSDASGDGADIFYWWYSLVSLLLYGIIAVTLTYYAARLSRLSRAGMASAAALLALAAGLSGLVFFSGSITALAVLATLKLDPHRQGAE